MKCGRWRLQSINTDKFVCAPLNKLLDEIYQYYFNNVLYTPRLNALDVAFVINIL